MTHRRMRDEFYAAARSCIRRAAVVRGEERMRLLSEAVDHTISALRCPPGLMVPVDEVPRTTWTKEEVTA